MDQVNLKITKQKVSADSKAYGPVKKVYEEAFPEIERYDFDLILKLCEARKGKLFVYYAEEDFAGFSFVLEDERYVYLFYLAAVRELRDKGFGTEMMKMVLADAGNKSVVLDIEPPELKADNADQRKRRALFYERLGFSATCYEMADDTGFFRIYSNKPESFDPKTFKQMWPLFPQAFDGTKLFCVKNGEPV